MNRIILHWTGGAHKPNSRDRSHYHFLVDGDGMVIPSIPVENNAAPLSPGYAGHTLNCNTNSIGVAICACLNANENPLDFGSYPPTARQLGALVELVASLCRQYHIPVDSHHVLTHGEVQHNLGIRQRGKWDLNALPHIQGPGGDYLRRAIKGSL